MKRGLALVLVAVSLVLSARLAPRPATGDGGALVAIAGPLRPFLADLLWIRFEQRLLHRDHFGLAQDADRLLRLRPDVDELWIGLSYALVLDVPGEVADEGLARAWVREGFRILDEGQRRFPGSSGVARARGECLMALALDHRDRLPATVSEPWVEALDAYEWALSLARSGPDLDLSRLGLALLVERLLGGEGSEQARFRAVRLARQLLARDDLSAVTRARLQEALDGRD